MPRRAIRSLLPLLLATTSLAAQGVPSTIPFQGRLTLQSNGGAVSGSVKIVASLYKTSSGGAALWTETHNSVAPPRSILIP